MSETTADFRPGVDSKTMLLTNNASAPSNPIGCRGFGGAPHTPHITSHQSCHAQAAAANTTVSEMCQRLLRVAVLPPLRREDLPPLTRRAQGMLPSMTDREAEAALDEHRMRKYGA